MKVHLMVSHGPLLQTLNQALSKRYEIGLSLLRTPGQSVSELLAPVVDGLLILENDVDVVAQDLTTLSAVLKKRPRLLVILLTAR